MFFHFKRKKIVVDFFISHSGVYNLFPIRESKYYLPDWFKQLPTKYKLNVSDQGPEIEQTTIRRCNGIIDLYQQGFVIPMWCDLALETFENGSISWFWNVPHFQSPTQHTKDQFGGNFDNLIHLKILNPWRIKEKSGVKFIYKNLFYENLDLINQISVAPGILDFKYQHYAHISLFFDKKPNKFILEAGRPLVQAIPLSENEIVIKNHLISDQEYKNIEQATFLFSSVGYYLKRKKILKNKKCPF